MKLVMTLLVRNEEDILDANMRYHLDRGVDHIIVTDNLSTDGTPDIIQEYVTQGVASHVHELEDTYAQSKWVSRMARMAHDDLGATWVIHNDADEFWMPLSAPDLRSYFSKRWFHNVVVAPRHDFICVEQEDGPFWSRMVYKKTVSLNPLGRPLPPKVAHRSRSGVTVAQGNHAVTGMGWERQCRKGMEILHFPLRSRSQYIRKIETGGRAYEQNKELAPSVGATWRKQYAELRETGTLAFLDENVVPEASLDAMMSDGSVVTDTRLRDFFLNLNGTEDTRSHR